MSSRLIRIVARNGDDGSTGPGDGSRVTRDPLRAMTMGDGRMDSP